MEKTRFEVLKISELVERAHEEGIPVSAYTIRRAIKTGALPCRILGSTYLVCWSRFLEWVTCADGQDNPPLPEPESEPVQPVVCRTTVPIVAGGIRRQY